MADRPIIFSAPMIAALLAGRKTQTRRILRPQIEAPGQQSLVPAAYEKAGLVRWKVGDRLWVRENHQFRGASYNDGTEGEPSWSQDEWFRVWGCGGPGDSWDPEFPSAWSPSVHMGVHDLTGPEHSEGPDVRGFATKVLPSIHMPRWASRLTLLVTDVRVERLQDISEADAIDEGALTVDLPTHGAPTERGQPPLGQPPSQRFQHLWESINGPGAWAANPWVVAIGFTVHARNIDQLAPIAEVAA